MGFYGLNVPTNSVKALKEDWSQGLGFNPIRTQDSDIKDMGLGIAYTGLGGLSICP